MKKSTNIVLTIHYEINNSKIAEIKEFLTKEYGNEYTTPPHISFIIMPFSTKYLSELDEKMTEFFKQVRTFSVKTKGIEAVDGKGHKFVYLALNEKLIKRIHLKLLPLCNQFHDNLIRRKDFMRLEKNPAYFSNEEKGVLNKYGYARSEKFFIPHITLGDIHTNEKIVDLNIVKKEVAQMMERLESKKGTTFQIKSLRAIVAKDTKAGEKENIIWEKEYWLSNLK